MVTLTNNNFRAAGNATMCMGWQLDRDADLLPVAVLQFLSLLVFLVVFVSVFLVFVLVFMFVSLYDRKENECV